MEADSGLSGRQIQQQQQQQQRSIVLLQLTHKNKNLSDLVLEDGDILESQTRIGGGRIEGGTGREGRRDRLRQQLVSPLATCSRSLESSCPWLATAEVRLQE